MQTELPGIGQQKVTLADWKNENEIFTHKARGLTPEELPWSAWSEIEDPSDYISTHDPESMGYGSSEKEAILNLCAKEGRKPPFWW
ncbi:hypothetical protein [Endozoicomonas sp. ISHI1]|uniref:hypothetical protein n=1 Tax=Endozoicomonas sp. ISHI1 TaxID=2825882 RepID=UPI0021475DD1|nr:hypothetical protein [Endozoicomonas sp. ISHI1]